MFCSRLNENSRQAKVSKLSLVLWLNENIRFRGRTAGHVSGKRSGISRTEPRGWCHIRNPGIYVGALASEETYPAPPAVWTPLSETTMIFFYYDRTYHKLTESESETFHAPSRQVISKKNSGCVLC